MKTFLRLISLLTVLLPAAHLTFSQQNPSITARLLAVNSASYPAIDAYLSVMDADQLIPITNLTAENFFIDTDTGQVLTLLNVTPARRPLHVVAVIDATGSVSERELANQAAAVRKLAEALQPTDQLGIVVMDHATAEIAAPLGSKDTALPALDTLAPRENVTGNVFWDGVYTAVNLLQAPATEARQAVVIMTDVSVRGGEGEHTDQETIAFAIARGVEVYGLHFEFEDDGIPENAPLVPPELTIIAQATGGSTLGVAAQLVSEDNYTDDEALPIMIQAFAALMLNEYRLSITSPLPADGSPQGLNITITYQDSRLPPLRGEFVAGTSPITIEFIGLTEQQDITLPYTVALNMRSSEGTLQKVTAYAVNQAGLRALLGEFDPSTLTLTIEPGTVGSGVFRLLVEAQDSAGNTAETDIFLNVVENLSVTLVDVPAEIQVNQMLTILARIGKAESVQNVTFSINGEQRELRTQPPFNELAFQWQPEQVGEYQLSVSVEDAQGSTASQQATVIVKARAAAQQEGGMPAFVWVIAAFAMGVLVIVGGGSVIAWRLRRRISPAAPNLPELPAPSIAEVPTGEEAVRPPPVAAPSVRYADAELQGSSGERWRLLAGETTIGRHSHNAVQIKDESVSRYHAKIEAVGDRYTFYDWQASHPSEINGSLLEAGKRYELHDGDMIRMGSSLVKFVKLAKER